MMKVLGIILALCILMAKYGSQVASSEGGHDDNSLHPRIKVEVMYESMCPDSSKFITKQLYPTFKLISGIMDVRLLPFGKASFKQLNGSVPWAFTCQHGHHECVGNMMHACAIKLYPEQKKHMAFIDCLFQISNYQDIAKNCSQQLRLDYEELIICTTGMEGINLLHSNGLRTQKLVGAQKPSFVPWIVIDNDASKSLQVHALYDLMHSVCERYKGDDVAACEIKLNNIAY